MSDHVGNKALVVYRTANSATITGSMLVYSWLLAGRWSLAVPGVGLAVAVGTSGTLTATLAGAGIIQQLAA